MAITYLGGNASQSAGAAASVTLGVGVTTAQGIVVLAIDDTNTTPSTPVDTASNTYTVDDHFGIGGNIVCGLFSCLTPTALSIGNTISSTLASQRTAIHAYSFDLPTGFDGTGGTSNGEGRATSSSVSDNLQSLVTTNANDCLFAGVGCTVNTSLGSVTAGWNAASTPSVVTDTGWILFAFSQVVAATGTYNLTGTLGSALGNWVLVNAGYKYTPAPTNPPPLPQTPAHLIYMRKNR